MGEIVEIAENVWRTESHIQMLPAFGLPITMTILGTPEGLILHSPTKLDDDLAQKIEALGEPRALIAPSLMHHMYVAGAKQSFPAAEVFGPKRLAKKNAELADLTPLESCEATWTEHLTPIPIGGTPSVDEFAFFHKPSATLLLTDVVFNLEKADGWIAKLYLRWSDALGKPMQSKLWRLITKDRRAAAESFRHILDLDIQRVVVGHGDVIEGDVKAQLEQAWQWMLQRGK